MSTKKARKGKYKLIVVLITAVLTSLAPVVRVALDDSNKRISIEAGYKDQQREAFFRMKTETETPK